MKLNLMSMILLFVLIIVWLGLHGTNKQWTAVKIAGAVLSCASLILLIVARVQLGAAFAVQAKAKKLVTTGLYSRIRNPIYVFGGLLLVGIAMVTGRWECILLLAVLTLMQIYRVRNEESVLYKAFGEEYVKYKARTWF
jgi:protein-S-isoprenylcysteine O-methyltransferase Ste14